MSSSKIKELINKSPKLVKYALLAILCIILLILMNSSGEEKEAEKIEEAGYSSESYRENLENEIKDIISKIEGVGEAEVMITLKSEHTYEYVQDRTSESYKTVIISNKEAILKTVVYPEISGVLVVCKGGNKASVVEDVTNAVSTLLNIPTNRVFVSALKNKPS